MKKIAENIVENYSGRVPCDFDSILRLKGVGVYIASATLNFGCDIPTPAVDRNVLRVLNRLHNITSEFIAREYISELYKFGNHQKIAYSLIDLGALICITNPKCDMCKLKGFCPKFDLREKEWKLLRKTINKRNEIVLRKN